MDMIVRTTKISTNVKDFLKKRARFNFLTLNGFIAKSEDIPDSAKYFRMLLK